MNRIFKKLEVIDKQLCHFSLIVFRVRFRHWFRSPMQAMMAMGVFMRCPEVTKIGRLDTILDNISRNSC